MTELELQSLDAEFPHRAASAFDAARSRVLASGQPVLQSDGGTLQRLFPDGRRIPVKRIDPPVFIPQSSFIITGLPSDGGCA